MYAWLSRFEVLIAIVAFALLAILTVPRGVQAEVSKSRSGSIESTLEIVQNAIDRYALDHHAWPGVTTNPDAPGSDSLNILLQQLTCATNAAGEIGQAVDSEFCFGPYISTDSAAAALDLGLDPPRVNADWRYDPTTGRLQHASSHWAQRTDR
jgi:competence protein ComGC